MNPFIVALNSIITVAFLCVTGTYWAQQDEGHECDNTLTKADRSAIDWGLLWYEMCVPTTLIASALLVSG